MDNQMAEQEISNFNMEQLELGQERLEGEAEAIFQDDPQAIVNVLRTDINVVIGFRLNEIMNI